MSNIKMLGFLDYIYFRVYTLCFREKDDEMSCHIKASGIVFICFTLNALTVLSFINYVGGLSIKIPFVNYLGLFGVSLLVFAVFLILYRNKYNGLKERFIKGKRYKSKGKLIVLYVFISVFSMFIIGALLRNSGGVFPW